MPTAANTTQQDSNMNPAATTMNMSLLITPATTQAESMGIRTENILFSFWFLFLHWFLPCGR